MMQEARAIATRRMCEQAAQMGADGIVMIPAVTKEVLFPFLFSSRGDAVLLEPEDLRAELKNELQTMLKDY